MGKVPRPLWTELCQIITPTQPWHHQAQSTKVPMHQCCAESHMMELRLLKLDEGLGSGHAGPAKLAKRQHFGGALNPCPGN